MARPRCPLSADDFTVVLHLLSVVERSKSLAPVKSASAAIVFFKYINLFNYLPTQSPAAGIMWQAAARNFGQTPKQGKEGAFPMGAVVAFAQAYGVQN